MTAAGGGGANAYASGGAGGTGGGNSGTMAGSAGIGAGGGGYVGGLTGDYVVHNHSGSGSYYGGCYTTAVYCGGRINTEEEEGELGGWYQGCCGEGSTAENGVCIQCGHDHSDGTHCSHPWFMGGSTRYFCSVCGEEYGENIGSCNRLTGYSLACGMTQGQVVSVKASFGGTNYISDQYGCKNQNAQSGVQNGNGIITIKSEDVGYLEVTKLDNVPARDNAAPGKITGYQINSISGNVKKVSLTRPTDGGTLYYHQAKSYKLGTSSTEQLAESNITANTLTTGVKGYYYSLNTSSTGSVTSANTWLGVGANEDAVTITLTSSTMYLHIAAADGTGNIGPVAHIKLEESGGTTVPEEKPDTPDTEEEYAKKVVPKTDPLGLKASEYVYAAGTNRFYIKADGATEHLLHVQGYLNGAATDQYQVDWLQSVSEEGGRQEWYRAKVPKVDISVGSGTFENNELVTNASVENLQLVAVTWATASRTNQSKVVKLDQRFTVNAALDGRQITVYPRALAELKGKEYASDLTEDKTHGLILIPDGVAPTITGISALESAGNINMTEAKKEYLIQASDSGSGVRSLKVTINNQDNGMTRTYTSDDGSLTITMQRDDYLFLGDFIVNAEAVDNVGNRHSVGSDKLAFTLEAELKRSRYPYNGDFKAGDGAVLTVTTGGYADKVIIRFPEELLRLNPNLNKEYVYDFPEAICTEIYEFNIPLGTPGGTYIIEVEAWKNGRKLMEELELPVRTLGSIWDEFRTRIRDNGV